MSDKKYLTYCINFITSVILFLFVFYIGQFMCFWCDDIFFGIYNISEDGIFKNLLYTHGGGVFCYFFTKLFNFYLPIILKYHPGDFIMLQTAIFKALFVIVTLFLMAKFSMLYSKSKIILSSSFIFFAGYTLSIVIYKDISIFISNFSFFRSFFVLLFFAVFWYYIFRNILLPANKKIRNYRYYKFPAFQKIYNLYEILFICFCGLIISSSMETVIVTSVFLVFSVYFCNMFIKLISFSDISFKKFLFNLNYKFYLPVLSLFTGSFIYFNSHGFNWVAEIRGLSAISINFDTLKDFSSEFFKHYILNFSVYYIILILLVITLCMSKKTEIKKLILPILLQISVIVGVFSLALCGKTHYDGSYWLNSTRVFVDYALMLPLCAIMYFSYLTKIKFDFFKKSETKILYTLFLIFLIITALIFFGKTVENNMTVKYYKQIKVDNYIAEKMCRFFNLKNKQALIPTSLMYEQNPPNNISPYLYQIKLKPYILDSDKYTFSEIYLPIIYKDNKSAEIGYYFSNNAYEIFEKEGGNFSDEELKHIKFSRLLDNNFVLNITENP